jgi:predicted dehydrogenase
MAELRFAILGFGKMGKIRYETLARMPGCRVVSVYDMDTSKEFPAGVRQVKSPQDIFQDQAIDAVIICAPNHLLKEYAVSALRSGKHVFCEKPPGRNMAELKEIMAAEAAALPRKLMFGFNHRHHESMLHAKKLIDSGEFGNVLWMRGRYGKSVNENFFSEWRSKKEFAGGGIFLDQGIHMLDLFLLFCGDFDETHAFVSNLYWKLDVEDNVFAIFRNKKGQVASLHSTMTQWRHLFSLEIFLERGYITINGLKTSSNTYGDEAMTIVRNRSLPPAAVWSEQEDIVFHTDYSWKKEMDMFVESVAQDQPVPSGNSADALKLMRLVEAVYKNQ